MFIIGKQITFKEHPKTSAYLVLEDDGVGGVLYGALVEAALVVDELLVVLAVAHRLVHVAEDLLAAHVRPL